MKYFALTYDVVPGFAEKRAPYREAHLQQMRDASTRGLLMLAGPLGDPIEAAMLVFRAESASPVEAFARADPYVTEGLVTAWRVRPWQIVVGAELFPSRVL